MKYFHFRSSLFLLILFNLTLNPLSGFAQSYEWIGMGEDDIQIISNARVEAEFRLNLIAGAETSIDLVTYDQRMDKDVGLPILDELAKAAARGVRVKYAISGTMTPVSDPFNSVGHYLDKITTQYPNFEYLFAGGTTMMWRSSWGSLDGMHEKLLIVDDKIALVTGRGHADIYLDWLDTAFVLKGDLVKQSTHAFARLWASIQRELKLEPKEDLPVPMTGWAENAGNPPLPAHPHLLLSEAEQSELSTLIDWKDQPPSDQKKYRARLLHHNFFDQIHATGRKPNSISTRERLQILSDPIVEEIKRLLPDASSMQYCSLAAILNPQVKQCMLESLTRSEPIQIEMLTNCKAGHSSLSGFHWPVGWYAGLKDLDDLLCTGNVKIFTLNDPNLGTTPPPPKWLHRKLILIEAGEKSTVIFGSHNLTYASTVVLDEMSFEIESLDFYKKMRLFFEDNLVQYGTEALPSEIHSERSATSFNQRLASNFYLIF